MPESDCGFDKQVYGVLTQYVVPFFLQIQYSSQFRDNE